MFLKGPVVFQDRIIGTDGKIPVKKRAYGSNNNEGKEPESEPGSHHPSQLACLAHNNYPLELDLRGSLDCLFELEVLELDEAHQFGNEIRGNGIYHGVEFL